MGVQIPGREGGSFEGERARPRTYKVDTLKSTRQGAAPVQRGCRLWRTRCGAQWRNLANTTEPSASGGGDATSRHITSVKVKVKAFHTRYRALGPELIPVHRQSARR